MQDPGIYMPGRFLYVPGCFLTGYVIFLYIRGSYGMPAYIPGYTYQGYIIHGVTDLMSRVRSLSTPVPEQVL